MRAGSRYFILTDTAVAPGYPRPISDTWPSVGGNIDAALYYEPVTTSDRFGNQIVTEPGHLFLFKVNIALNITWVNSSEFVS